MVVAAPSVPVSATLLLVSASSPVAAAAAAAARAAAVVVERLSIAPFLQTVILHLAIVASSAAAQEAEVAKVVAAAEARGSDLNKKGLCRLCIFLSLVTEAARRASVPSLLLRGKDLSIFLTSGAAGKPLPLVCGSRGC